MRTLKIVIAWPQVLYERGGTEVHTKSLIKALKRVGHSVDSYTIPFAFDTIDEIVRSCLLWEYAALPSQSFRKPDYMITTKFPSYWLNFQPKVIWLIHQFRQVYDLLEHPENFITPFNPQHFDLIRWITERDRIHFKEAKAIFTNGTVTKERLYNYLGIEGEVLYPPPAFEGKYRCDVWEPEILVVQRLDKMKRTDLIIRALQHIQSPFKCLIIGTGLERENLENLVRELKLSNRVSFAGFVTDDELISAYARCRCVVYVPYDEEYGYITIEAFKSKKPVITTSDAGGPLDFVLHEKTGWVAEPKPPSIARGIEICLQSIEVAKKWGEAGYTLVQHISWENVICKLLESVEEDDGR